MTASATAAADDWVAAPRRAAVVVNVARVRRPRQLRRQIERELARRGWLPPLWLETTRADPGTGQAATALAAGVDLVLAVGGDGTARAVIRALSGTDVPVGLLPAGTGNLLARNLGTPLTRRRALRVALTGTPTPIDLLRWETTADDGSQGGVADGVRQSGLAAVMMGIGVDAAVLRDTDLRLKRWLGQAAYAVAGLRHIEATPVPTSITIDDAVPLRRDASLVEVGNVGRLTVGLTLFPAADARDGQLDVLVASPRDVRDVGRMIGGVLLQRSRDRLLDRRSGGRVVVETESPVLCQVDGDLVGKVRRLEVEVLPGAVRVVLAPTATTAGWTLVSCAWTTKQK